MKSTKLVLSCLILSFILLLLIGCRDGSDYKVIENDSVHVGNGAETTGTSPEHNETTSTLNNGSHSSENASSEGLESQANAIECPWNEPGTKQPSEYTWEEYEALSDMQKEAFFETFETAQEFDLWYTNARGEILLPWEEGGKQPPEYTWEEYEALSDMQKEAFFESFLTTQEFDLWFRKSRGEDLLPWEEGGKQPSEYTWEEYESLSEDEKASFQMAFADIVAFDTWIMNAQSNVTLPWENGGKQPIDYTWEEYEALDEFLKEAFFESFEDEDDLKRWLEKNTPD